MKIIAHLHTPYKEKFGIPRQSGIAPESEGTVVFEPEYRVPEALRGIEGYSHLWLLWQFSEAEREDWSPTVRPPRLGGNKRVGVFATRSPFRPNPIGLSSVKLLGVEKTADCGIVLRVAGADLLDGTPIYDIKPYLAYTDSHPDAVGGFSDPVRGQKLTVAGGELLSFLPAAERETVLTLLAEDPRPHYQSDPAREYAMKYGTHEYFFTVAENLLTLKSVK